MKREEFVMTSARLVWLTPNADRVIAYCARVSNPENQNNSNTEKLIKYCADNGHWSIFEMANLCVEVKTSVAIGRQLLRHKSFSFQEFSQRYAKASSFHTYTARLQDKKNRQNSLETDNGELVEWFNNAQQAVQKFCERYYNEALEFNVAKEMARFLLPMSTSTTLYVNGTIRSWIHYLDLRTQDSTQKEHRDVALAVKDIFRTELPVVSRAVWGD
jgi:thymidylate synthase (FAD)